MLFVTLFFVSCGKNKNQQEQNFVHEANKMHAGDEEQMCSNEVIDSVFVYELNEMLNTGAENGMQFDEVIDPVFDLIKRIPQSLEYEFEFEEEIPYVNIVTSNDGNIRAYNIDRCGFGGNPSRGFDCRTMLQYRLGDSVFCKEIDFSNGIIQNIWHVDSNKYYLLEYWQGYMHQGVRETHTLYLCKIENDKHYKVRGAFSNGNNVSDHIKLYWDDWGGEFFIDYEKENSVFVYNSLKKELYVLKGMPVKGTVLKYRPYCWNKQCFELKKCHKTIEYCDDNYFVQIEQQDENFWTYRCWNNGQKHGEPSLIINHGIKQCWTNNQTLISFDELSAYDESSLQGEKYTFFNDGYRYEYERHWDDDRLFHALHVYSPNEELIYDHGIFD